MLDCAGLSTGRGWEANPLSPADGEAALKASGATYAIAEFELPAEENTGTALA